LRRTDHDQRFAVTLRRRIRITESCWLALRGRGVPIKSLKRAQLPPTPYHCSDAVAHTGIIRVIVGGKPIGLRNGKNELVEHLRKQKAFYAERAKYENDEQKAEMLGLFDQAIQKLR